MTKLIYVQATGNLYEAAQAGGEPLHRCYSGNGSHRDNPSSQCVTDRGPIPVGTYTISDIGTWEGMGHVLKLNPDPDNDMCGRSGFLIHGDSASNPGTASNGCIILNGAEIRKGLGESYKTLEVVAFGLSAPHGAELLGEEIEPLFLGESVDSGAIPDLLGAGFSRHARKFRNILIERGAISVPPTPGDARVETNFGLVASSEEFQSVIETDARLSGSSGPFSASASASLRRSFSSSKMSVTIALTKKVVSGVFRLAQFPISDLAKEEAKDPLRYLRVFGDSMITGVGVGGACCYLFQFNFNTEKEATDFKASISASYGSASGSYSQAFRNSLQRTNAAISLRGYSTGTIAAPDLFGPVNSDGSGSFLFDIAFSNRMIAGVLDYFDTFSDRFSIGNAGPGYSQCDLEVQALDELPSLIDNQDDIARRGGQLEVIANDLDVQSDHLDRISAGLRYSERYPELTIDGVDEERAAIKAEVAAANDKIVARRQTLAADLDGTSSYDFRGEIPRVPEYIVTGDPIVKTENFGNPRGRGRWRSKDFKVRPIHYGRACWIHATASICSVRHRPNGGRVTLELWRKKISKDPAVTDDALPELIESYSYDETSVDLDGDSDANLSSRDDVVETDTVLINRGRVRRVAVGGFVFCPNRVGETYFIKVNTTGNYRCGSSTTMTTKISR